MKTNAIQGIQAIEPATKVKTDAKNAIDQSAETQHNAIFNNNDATLEEQQAAQQLLDQAVATAKQNINAADTNQKLHKQKIRAHKIYLRFNRRHKLKRMLVIL